MMRHVSDNKPVADYTPPYELWAVVNPYGQFWSGTTYHSEEEALGAVKAFWKDNKDNAKKFKAIPVSVVLSDARIEMLTREEAVGV